MPQEVCMVLFTGATASSHWKQYYFNDTSKCCLRPWREMACIGLAPRRLHCAIYSRVCVKWLATRSFKWFFKLQFETMCRGMAGIVSELAPRIKHCAVYERDCIKWLETRSLQRYFKLQFEAMCSDARHRLRNWPNNFALYGLQARLHQVIRKRTYSVILQIAVWDHVEKYGRHRLRTCPRNFALCGLRAQLR